MLREVDRVLGVPGAFYTVPSLHVERETLFDIQTWMQKANELSMELLIGVNNSEEVQNNDMLKRSQPDKSVRDLGLVIAGIESELEKPHAREGATAVGGAAG